MLVVRLLFSWLIRPQSLAAGSLGAIVVFGALGVAYSSHESRNMYRDLQQLEKDHDDLEHEYEKLLLEQSAWADYTRLNQLAQERLFMSAPAADDMVVLR